MKTVKKTGIVFLALLLALLLLSPLATIHLGPRELTVGLVGVAYASETPDYTADGSADNVQFQDAIAALPATGGIIRILPGTYTFSATVTRAVANVTIQGAGKNTKINYNASSPVFTAGGDGWVFKDFATDAGGVNIAGRVDWLIQNVWVGTAYYALYTYSGTLTFYNAGGNAQLVGSAANVLALADGDTFAVEEGISIISSAQSRYLIQRTGTVGSATAPTFQIGNIAPGGDNAPVMAVLYSASGVSERIIAEFDSNGILGSVRQSAGIHFEGYVSGDAEPYIRLTDTGIQVGPGGATAPDTELGRVAAGILGLAAGDSFRIPSDGVLQVGTDQVVGARVVDARADDVVDAVYGAEEAGVLDALRDAMIAHGLVAP